MSLKIAQMACKTVKNLMSNPIAKTVGIGAVFGAGLLIGKGDVGFDLFEKEEKVETISTIPTEELSEVERTPQVEATQSENKKAEEVKQKIAEVKKVVAELDKLPIENKQTKQQPYLEPYGDSQFLTAGKREQTEGTVNYNGQTYKVVMIGYDSCYWKEFYDNDNNLIYSLHYETDISGAEPELSSFEFNKYDNNNRVLESVGDSEAWYGLKGQKIYEYKDVPTGNLQLGSYIDKEGNTKEFRVVTAKPNEFTEIQYDKDRADITIKDKNGHIVAEACTFGENGEPPKVEMTDGKVTKLGDIVFRYNKDGLLEYNGNSQDKLKYDSRGNLVEVTNDDIHKYQLKYDNDNNLIDVVKKHQNKSSY